MPKRVLVLGGGVGGVVAAKRIAERTRGRADVEITLVSDTDYYLLPPLLVNIALGDISPQQAMLPLSRFAYRNVKTVKAAVKKVDPDNRTVETEQGKFQYDYLIASLGTDFDFKSYNLGVGNHNYTLDGALKFKEALANFHGGSVVVYTPEPVYRCGVYPFEIVGQLDAIFRKRGIRGQDGDNPHTPVPAPDTAVGAGGREDNRGDLRREEHKIYRRGDSARPSRREGQDRDRR
jgi:NADH dehydrogenase, FAD-containing subunit